VSRRIYGVRVSAGLNGPLNPALNLFDVARVGVDFGGAADAHSETRIRINAILSRNSYRNAPQLYSF